MKIQIKTMTICLLSSLSFYSFADTLFIEDFIVRKGDNITIEFRPNSHIDKSGKTNICTKGGETYCYKGTVLAVEATVTTEGLTTIGPYEIKFGETTVMVPTGKVLVLPKIKDNEIDIQGAVDPNGSGIFLLRTEWSNLEKPLPILHRGITLRKDIFVVPCSGKKGLEYDSHGGSPGDTSGEYRYRLKNTSGKTITLTNKDFINLPKDYQAIAIDIPPQSQASNCSHQR